MAAAAFSALAQSAKPPADYVDTNIGGIGILLTSTAPYVQYPHGMARAAAVTTPGISDRYLADKIYGFSVGPITFMASQPDASTDAVHDASGFDHDFEIAKPYSYAVRLLDSDIFAEMTVTRRAALDRFTFSGAAQKRLVLRMSKHASLAVVSSTTIEGSQEMIEPLRYGDHGSPTLEYFFTEFSAPFHSDLTWLGNRMSDGASRIGDDIGFIGNFEGA